MSNYTFDLCKFLGVEEDTIFYLSSPKINHNLPKVIRNNVLYSYNADSTKWVQSTLSLNEIAKAEIVNKPFIPVINEVYFSIDFDRLTTQQYTWKASPRDYFLLKNDLVFNSHAGAFNALSQILNECDAKLTKLIKEKQNQSK